jgi:hypothetical protein
MKQFNKLIINNIDTIESICAQKAISLETLSNFLFNQYIIYYHEAIKTLSIDYIKPQSQGIREGKIESFKRFIDTYPVRKGKGR